MVTTTTNNEEWNTTTLLATLITTSTDKLTTDCGTPRINRNKTPYQKNNPSRCFQSNKRNHTIGRDDNKPPRSDPRHKEQQRKDSKKRLIEFPSTSSSPDNDRVSINISHDTNNVEWHTNTELTARVPTDKKIIPNLKRTIELPQRTQSRQKPWHNVNLTTDPTTTELNDQTNHHHGVPRSNQSYTSLAWKRNRHTSKGVVGNSNKTTTVTTTIQKKSQNAVINKNKLMWNDIKPQNLTQRSNPRTNKTTKLENANAIHYTKSAESTISEMTAPAGNSGVNDIQPQITPSNKEPVPTFKGAGRKPVPQPKRPPKLQTATATNEANLLWDS